MEQIAEKKKAIFESTLELVKDNGFHGTPMSMVAKNAGVAAGTIYHYFESKENLLCELFSYIRKQMIEAVQQGDDESIPYKDRFFGVCMNLYWFYINNPNVLKFFEQFVNSPYNEKGSMSDDFNSLLFNFYQKGIKSGQIRNVTPEIASVLAHGNVITMAKIHTFGKIAFEDTDLKQILQILWNGMTNNQSTDQDT
ncbi:TetR/AcrR family transcriptional regulator [Pontibacter silvestris]|uniref:TetR/AcrR family transcriptional regulator n=1 Tax=Pontibacter silvestris TaxID=2305183 RepID=A0ABW4WXE7_9BACT|nr:TetR/AcrR family transcriptional regulator [Pontibacter silvestris]MCC9137395.1 TetR/AcrR family transcriptional regulator [Pontibacter silvestris]